MKTIEEAAEEYALSHGDGNRYRDSEIGFVDGIEFAQRWISVQDEKPPVEKKKNCENFSINVFLKSDSNDISIGYYSYMSGSFIVRDRDLKYMKVISWRPIERL